MTVIYVTEYLAQKYSRRSVENKQRELQSINILTSMF